MTTPTNQTPPPTPITLPELPKSWRPRIDRWVSVLETVAFVVAVVMQSVHQVDTGGLSTDAIITALMGFALHGANHRAPGASL